MSYNPRVSYFYDSEVGNYHYGQGHPMKPHRVRMAHNLIVNYNLYKEMDIFRPPLIDHTELTRFHSDDYVNFLRTITPDNMHDHLRQLQRFNVGEDCLSEDMQLLTSRGFMFLKDIEALSVQDKETLQVATYNHTSGHLLYETPTKYIVKPAARGGAQKMVQINSTAPASSNSNSSSSSSSSLSSTVSSGISMVVTPAHDLFFSDAGSSLATFNKHSACSLLSLSPQEEEEEGENAAAGVQFLTSARHGLNASSTSSVAEVAEAAASVSIHDATEETLHTFMQVYGYLVGDKSNRTTSNTASAPQPITSSTIASNVQWITSRLSALLGEDEATAKFVVVEQQKDTTARVSIVDQAWCNLLLTTNSNIENNETQQHISHNNTNNNITSFQPWAFELNMEFTLSLLSGLSALTQQNQQQQEQQKSSSSSSSSSSFVTTSAQLRDDIVRLALHAGQSVYFTTSTPEKMSTTWSIYWSPEQDSSSIVNNNNNNQQVSEIMYQGRTWCVNMPHGMIITRRAQENEQGIVTHASTPVYIGNCPVFDGLFEFCQISASGSIGGAARLNSREADICVNWAGGLHHAKKSEASGFCYVNDCVLGILELLKHHQRVLYIDIDIHHGDGVEEAFYCSDRVMTLSLHKFGEYFPGTGDWRDIGYGKGANRAVNVPLRDGMDDDSYQYVFRPVVQRIMERYQPTAILLQCGADSLSGDRLGCFNLSLKGHGDCVSFMRSFGVPLLVCGGGGYTMRNVARCWAYETSLLVGQDIPDELPYNDYFEYYGPDYRLHITTSNMENLNDKKYLNFLKEKLFQQMDRLEVAPGVQINTGGTSTEVPRDAIADVDPYEGKDPNSRVKDDDTDKRQHKAEYYANEKDQDVKNGEDAAESAKRQRLWTGSQVGIGGGGGEVVGAGGGSGAAASTTTTTTTSSSSSSTH